MITETPHQHHVQYVTYHGCSYRHVGNVFVVRHAAREHAEHEQSEQWAVGVRRHGVYRVDDARGVYGLEGYYEQYESKRNSDVHVPARAHGAFG